MIFSLKIYKIIINTLDTQWKAVTVNIIFSYLIFKTHIKIQIFAYKMYLNIFDYNAYCITSLLEIFLLL